MVRPGTDGAEPVGVCSSDSLTFERAARNRRTSIYNGTAAARTAFVSRSFGRARPAVSPLGWRSLH